VTSPFGSVTVIVIVRGSVEAAFFLCHVGLGWSSCKKYSTIKLPFSNFITLQFEIWKLASLII